jgi:ferric-dicitrate binding protein FerR (iron transport regulator)
MKQEEQNKWETWASVLHNDAERPGTGFHGDADDKDFHAVRKIFNIREKVASALRLKPDNEAWDGLRRQLSPRKRRLEFLKYAAVFLISLLVTASAFWVYNNQYAGTNEYASITSPKGQISNVTLFDGTNIWLNAGSTLKYNQSFNQNNREVYLDGEALFSVTENKGLPFIVHAGDARVKVFGTEFNVKAYSDGSKIEAVLIEGKVEFTSNKKSVMMEPGDHIELSGKNGTISKNKVNTEEYTSWKGGKIYFNNETLLSLTLQLERWYEIKFSFQDEQVKSYRFTGVINKERSLDYTLNIIQEINKVKFEFDKEQIMIKDK